jgi:glycosyltransferase involved in cell wall biosynthesis
LSDKVSIIVPSYNEEKYIEGCLLSLVNSDYPIKHIEVIIVDGGSTDNTLLIVRKIQNKYPGIRIINNPEIITPVSLNIGVRNSTGIYVMIASAHSQFPSDYISSLLQKLEEINCDVIGGGIDTRVLNSTPVSEAIIKLLSSRFGVGNSLFRTEKNGTLYVDTVPFGIYKRSLFEIVGLYNEKLIRNHDIEFSKRLIKRGYKIVLFSKIRCIYYSRENYLSLARNSFNNGFWNIVAIYITRRLRSLSARHFIPLIFLLSLIIPLILCLFVNKYFISLTFLVFLVYIAAMSFASIRLREPLTKAVYIFWGFLVLHFAYGFGSFTGLFRIDKLFNK